MIYIYFLYILRGGRVLLKMSIFQNVFTFSIYPKSKGKAETILIPRSLGEFRSKSWLRSRRKFRRGLYEHGDIYDDYLAAIEITFTHDAIASVPPPSASSVPIVPDILRFRGWNNYNWSNLVLRTIYLLRSLSKQLPHNLSRPFLTLSIARERDFILSSFDQLPPFYMCICIHDRGQN